MPVSAGAYRMCTLGNLGSRAMSMRDMPSICQSNTRMLVRGGIGNDLVFFFGGEVDGEKKILCGHNKTLALLFSLFLTHFMFATRSYAPQSRSVSRQHHKRVSMPELTKYMIDAAVFNDSTSPAVWVSVKAPASVQNPTSIPAIQQTFTAKISQTMTFGAILVGGLGDLLLNRASSVCALQAKAQATNWNKGEVENAFVGTLSTSAVLVDAAAQIAEYLVTICSVLKFDLNVFVLGTEFDAYKELQDGQIESIFDFQAGAQSNTTPPPRASPQPTTTPPPTRPSQQPQQPPPQTTANTGPRPNPTVTIAVASGVPQALQKHPTLLQVYNDIANYTPQPGNQDHQGILSKHLATYKTQHDQLKATDTVLNADISSSYVSVSLLAFLRCIMATTARS